MFWGRLFHSLITEGKNENLKLLVIVLIAFCIKVDPEFQHR